MTFDRYLRDNFQERKLKGINHRGRCGAVAQRVTVNATVMGLISTRGNKLFYQHWGTKCLITEFPLPTLLIIKNRNK